MKSNAEIVTRIAAALRSRRGEDLTLEELRQVALWVADCATEDEIDAYRMRREILPELIALRIVKAVLPNSANLGSLDSYVVTMRERDGYTDPAPEGDGPGFDAMREIAADVEELAVAIVEACEPPLVGVTRDVIHDIDGAPAEVVEYAATAQDAPEDVDVDALFSLAPSERRRADQRVEDRLFVESAGPFDECDDDPGPEIYDPNY
jgi:hypothetical protein